MDQCPSGNKRKHPSECPQCGAGVKLKYDGYTYYSCDSWTCADGLFKETSACKTITGLTGALKKENDALRAEVKKLSRTMGRRQAELDDTISEVIGVKNESWRHYNRACAAEKERDALRAEVKTLMQVAPEPSRLVVATLIYAAAVGAGEIELSLDPDMCAEDVLAHADALIRTEKETQNDNEGGNR